MAIAITDNTSHFSVNYGPDITDSYPKNSVLMKRKGEKFELGNGGDRQRVLIEFDYSDVSAPVAVDSDALEIALAAIIFS